MGEARDRDVVLGDLQPRRFDGKGVEHGEPNRTTAGSAQEPSSTDAHRETVAGPTVDAPWREDALGPGEERPRSTTEGASRTTPSAILTFTVPGSSVTLPPDAPPSPRPPPRLRPRPPRRHGLPLLGLRPTQQRRRARAARCARRTAVYPVGRRGRRAHDAAHLAGARSQRFADGRFPADDAIRMRIQGHRENAEWKHRELLPLRVSKWRVPEELQERARLRGRTFPRGDGEAWISARMHAEREMCPHAPGKTRAMRRDGSSHPMLRGKRSP